MSAELYRAELRLHCYRLLGSLLDSEDLVEETFERARRVAAAATSAGLYRLATTACLEALAKRPPRVLPHDVVPASDPDGPAPAMTEHAWLEPYPDHLLGEDGDGLAERPTIELAFLAAIQLLPPKQRATLVLRDVLNWPAADTAALLDITVPATKSALQRARGTVREQLPAEHANSNTSEEEGAVLEQFLAALESGSADALGGVLAEHVRASFPPAALWVHGRDAVPRASPSLRSPGEMRCVATTANRQPAAAVYLRSPVDTAFRLTSLAVLRITAGEIAEIVEFGSPDVVAALGLPTTL
ncbi:MAG: polymerase sigma-70 factor, subfamily [Solirubrobacteraceae bacterium]|nr:polymerase sigma-70 factor, subfamily [Solirubrobacteraceae bacterium]